METTNKFKNPYGYHPAYGHCPICGRIYWDKCHVGNYCDSCGQRLEVERATVEIVKKGLPKLLEKAVATDAKEVNHEPF